MEPCITLMVRPWAVGLKGWHRACYRRERREPFVISVGAFTREKNPRFVIEALARVQGTRPRLVWVGNVANEQYLRDTREFASSMGVTSTPGSAFPIRTSSICNRTTAMLYAPRLEAFGLGPLEGNACGP
jgi:glycosyltransferase involved in cell wall biosynthesis